MGYFSVNVAIYWKITHLNNCENIFGSPVHQIFITDLTRGTFEANFQINLNKQKFLPKLKNVANPLELEENYYHLVAVFLCAYFTTLNLAKNVESVLLNVHLGFYLAIYKLITNKTQNIFLFISLTL